jgi:hypothetical protein
MFKIGDRVICIHKGRFRDKVRSDDGVHLKVGKIYEVLDTKQGREDFDTIVDMILITDGGYNSKRWCTIKRFMSLLEFRRIKIKKICSKLGK